MTSENTSQVFCQFYFAKLHVAGFTTFFSQVVSDEMTQTCLFSEENAPLKTWSVTFNRLHLLQQIQLHCNDECDISPCKHHIHL